MKFEVKMQRPENYCSWSGNIGRNHVTACNEDVDKLFEDLRSAHKCTFEISNVRPRYYDYQTFKWQPINCVYQATEITRGYTPNLTSYVSGCIRKRFLNKHETADPIFISAY